MSKKNIALLTVILAIFIDQIVKIYIKTNFFLGEEVKVFNWFRIHFVENNGMAMGFEFGGKAGKLFLTLFRLVAVSAIVYWLAQHIKKSSHTAVILAISLIAMSCISFILSIPKGPFPNFISLPRKKFLVTEVRALRAKS